VLSFWGNEYIAALISDNIVVILPILYPALFEMSKTHWNQQIVQLTQSVLRYLHDVNRVLYDEVASQYRQNLVKYVTVILSVLFMYFVSAVGAASAASVFQVVT